MTVGATLPLCDVTPDGRHFVMVQSSDASPGVTQIHVVQNWVEEVRRRAPVVR